MSARHRLTTLVVIIHMSCFGARCVRGDSTRAPQLNRITFESLLEEMIDRDRLARFPSPEYRQMQASSYNRKSVARDQADQGTGGWFADSDGISCLRNQVVNGKTEWVLMEHKGPGCITKIWTPFFYYGFNDRVGPRIKIYLDGSETPIIDEQFIELLTRNDWAPDQYGTKPEPHNQLVVPSPFADFTARAGNLYLPIPFEKSCKISLDGKPFYHIVNYRAYSKDTQVTTFSMDQFHAARSLMDRVGRELLDPAQPQNDHALNTEAMLLPEESMSIELPKRSAAIRQLKIHVDPDQLQRNPAALRSTILKIDCDGRHTVWCPLGDFFGSPNKLNPFHTWSRQVTTDGTLTCNWIMPYRDDGRITLENLGKKAVQANITVSIQPWQWSDDAMHFHASWRTDDILSGNRFVDWNFVDIRGKGVLIGDQWTVLNLTDGWWGEGDEKIYLDDAFDMRKFPDHFGTGTEDYYGWAGGRNPTRLDVFNHPFLANISVGSTPTDSTRGFNILARHRGLDGIPFHHRLRFDMEASPGTQQRNAWNLLGYSAVTFWYARPGASSNRPPAPKDATKAIMSLESLKQRTALIRQARRKQIPGAIEFEMLAPTGVSDGLRCGPQRPAAAFRPDQTWSDGSHFFVTGKKSGDFVEFTFTEQFKPAVFTLYATKSFDFGVARVSMNGKVAADNIDLYSERPSVVAIDLGTVKPVNNRVVLRLELVSKNPKSKGAQTYMGLDCLLIKPVAHQ